MGKWRSDGIMGDCPGPYRAIQPILVSALQKYGTSLLNYLLRHLSLTYIPRTNTGLSSMVLSTRSPYHK